MNKEKLHGLIEKEQSNICQMFIYKEGIEVYSKRNVWFCDPQDVGTAGYGLCFSAADMAGIGLLCLNKGCCGDEQVISSQWIEEMTKPQIITGGKYRNLLYGYLWWIINAEKNIYAAIGNCGNVLYIDPENSLVISITSWFKPSVFDRIDFIEETIKPFILEGD